MYCLYVMNSDGSEKRSVLPAKQGGYNYNAIFLNNGRIAFVERSDGKYGICSVNPDGTDKIDILPFDGNIAGDSAISASPTKNIIAFVKIHLVGSNMISDIWLTDYEGKNQVQLPNPNNYSLHSPSFHPDGKRIAVIVGGADGLFLIDIVNGATNLMRIPNNVGYLSWSPFLPPTYLPSDIDQNTIVDIMDLIKVANKYGSTEKGRWDVNSDGVVDITDLILVATHLGEFSAPSRNPFDGENLLATTYQRMLLAETVNVEKNDNFYVAMNELEKRLEKELPTRTHLMQNYPNPFNPETYIPFALGENADVRIEIYSPDGRRVREIDLGYLQAGSYATKGKAAFWDGDNSLGEKAASGTYVVEMNAGGQRYLKRIMVGK